MPTAVTAASRTEPAPTPRWVWVALATGLVLTAVDLRLGEGAVAEWAYLIVASGAGLLGLLGARRSQHAPVASLVGVGVSLSALGDIIWQMYAWVDGTPPNVSLADLGWLGSYVAIGIALVRLLRTGTNRWLDREAWIDMVAVFAVAMLLQWELILESIVTDTSATAFERTVWSLYPALDVMLLALIVRGLLARRLRGAAATCLAAGAALWLASDTGYLLGGDGWAGTPLDAGWLLGAMALSAATWSPVVDAKARERDLAAADTADLVSGWRIAAGLSLLLVPGLVEVVGHAMGNDPNPVPLFITTAVLVVLSFARAMMLSTAGRMTRDRLRSHERRATVLATMASDAHTIVDRDARMKMEAPRLAALLGYHDVTMTGVGVFSPIHRDDREAAFALLHRAVEEPGRLLEAEIRGVHKDGHVLWLAVRVVNLLDDPDVEGVVVSMHDITARKTAEQALEHQAFHDALTGLPNRALFIDRVQQALRRSDRTGNRPAVLYLDLDGFKSVNDSLGHAAGDDLLRVVAERLQGAVRGGETIARLGGDEFAVLIEPNRTPVEAAQVVADRILQAVADPIELGDQTVTVTASVGIAGSDPSATSGSLLRDADVAMYKAKTSGKSRWVIYDAAMRVAVVEDLQLASDLSSAISEGQLALVYQPVIELESDRVVGFEALLRWHHPTLGTVPPDRFIPIAEENGTIVALGAWVLDEACRTAAAWATEHPDQALTMAVNISARQLACADLVDQVKAALDSSGLDPQRLVLEMTETALVRDATVAARRLHELRRLGIRLAIDDFGTGYSSLSYLRQFPVDILKIDRSFVDSITSREQVPAIVRGLLDLGRTLELEMIAEGVELEVQRDRLRAEHCDLAQGFLFAKPLDRADAEILLLHVAAGDSVRACAPQPTG